jgi:hypothetical protein
VEVWLAPRTILVTLKAQLSPAEGDAELARLIVPVNPSNGLTVIVDMPAWPARTVMLEGLAVREKSWSVKSTVAEREREPLLPVTVTV